MKSWLAALVMLWAGAVQAKPLIADLSGYRIELNSGFTGTHLLLFGTRNETGDVLVAVRGPENDYIVRKKEQVGGILWLNRKKQRFKNIPSFYLLASSKALKDMRDTTLLGPLSVGFEHIVGEGKPDFVQAFLGSQREKLLYNVPYANAAEQKVTFMDESLFKVQLPFPDNIPRGDYSVDIYLINDGHLTSMQSIPLKVERAGLDALIYSTAHNHALLYGIFATLMALSLGYASSRVLHK